MFRTKKTREAISYTLKLMDGKSTCGALTKLLYIADREALKRLGRSITGDSMYALPHGPILSIVLSVAAGRKVQNLR